MSISVFKVLFHFEAGAYGGKAHVSGQHQEHIAAASGDAATLAAVLNSNAKSAPAGFVVVIDAVVNEGSGSYVS